jgi:hypothetical protein
MKTTLMARSMTVWTASPSGRSWNSTVCTPIFERPRMTANRTSDGLATVARAAATAGSAGDTAPARPAETTRVNCRRLSIAVRAVPFVPVWLQD